jgi:hypothetical protein
MYERTMRRRCKKPDTVPRTEWHKKEYLEPSDKEALYRFIEGQAYNGFAITRPIIQLYASHLVRLRKPNYETLSHGSNILRRLEPFNILSIGPETVDVAQTRRKPRGWARPPSWERIWNIRVSPKTSVMFCSPSTMRKTALFSSALQESLLASKLITSSADLLSINQSIQGALT